MSLTHMKKFLPPTLVSRNYENINAVLGAIETGDLHVLDMIEQARFEFFLTTATGKYLIQLANQYGFNLPRDTGLDTEGIRLLAIPSIWLPKQTTYTFYRIVEAFYSLDVMHSSMVCTVDETYTFNNGDELIIETEAGKVNVTFREDLVTSLVNMTAGEVAGLINSQQNLIYADVYLNRETNKYQLRITSRTYGAEARLRIAGGEAQNILRFPSLSPSLGGNDTVWELDKPIGAYDNSLRFTWVGGTNPELWHSDIGDVVTFTNLPSDLNSLRGTYVIQDVGVDYFVIYDLEFQETFPYTFNQSSVEQIVFTSKRSNTIYDNLEYAIISEVDANTVDVSIPAVPPIVRRQLKGSAHLQGEIYPVVSFTKTSMTIAQPNRLPNSGSLAFGTDFSTPDYTNVFKYEGKSETLTGTQVFLTKDRVFPFMTLAESNVIAGANIENPMFVPLNENIVTVNTPNVKHNLLPGMEIEIEPIPLSITSTILSSIDGNVPQTSFTGTKIVKSTPDQYTFTYELIDSGSPVTYDGTVVTNFDIEFEENLNGKKSAVVFLFSSSSDVLESRLKPGMNVEVTDGTPIELDLFRPLLTWKLTVRNIVGNKVYLYSGKNHRAGNVASGATCVSAGSLGGSSFQYKLSDPFTPGATNYDFWFSGANVTLLESLKSNNPYYVGSFIYDTVGDIFPYVVSKYGTRLTQNVRKESSPGEMLVENAENFPTRGKVFVDYGSGNIEGPVEYIAINGISPATLVLKKSYVFEKSHDEGAQVYLLRQEATIELDDEASDYPVYLTGVLKARDAVETILRSVAASGVKVNIETRKPDLRYQDVSLDPFVDPSTE